MTRALAKVLKNGFQEYFKSFMNTVKNVNAKRTTFKEMLLD
jgi:hypothetical protein